MPKSLSSLRVLIIILAFLALGAGLAATSRITNPAKPEITPAPKTPYNILPPTGNDTVNNNASVIYASSTQDSTQLLAKKAGEPNSKIIAQLPDNIKHINYLSPQSIIFISDIDEADHGKFIKKYDSVADKYEILAEAQKDWGIDDVVISPDGSYIAWWEIKLTEKDQLLNGFSRVYTRNITNPGSTPVQLIDEKATETIPIHYPLFFDGANRLYLDSFIPNGGGLFYLGMYEADPNTPSSLQEIPEMKKGDFLSDPQLSPDGKQILFTAFDKNAAIQIPNHSNSNLLVILDLSTRQKTIIGTSDNGTQYANPKWLNDGSAVIYQGYRLSSPTEFAFEGAFIKRLADNQASRINIHDYSDFSLLDIKNNYMIWGRTTTDIGNLGKKYSQILSEIDITNISSAETVLSVSQPVLQYISTINNLGEVKGIATKHESLQLATFKPKIVPEKRRNQQNNPPHTPSRVLPTQGYDITITGSANRIVPTLDPSFPKCGNNPAPGDVGKCYDSPLYLYPTQESQVTIKVKNAEIFSDVPKIIDNSWNVVAYPDGKIVSDNQEYNKISFAYLSKPQLPPINGIVTSKDRLSDTLVYFANKLNLNDRESDDFVSLWRNYLPDFPYYLISFYDEVSAKKIIQYSFDPQPNTFLQVVMYFKPLEEPISIPPPTFVPKERKGFVAVDWSGIIDYK